MAGAGHRCDTGRKLNRLRLLLLLIAFLCAAPVSAQGYRVIATYPHDRSAFTEGLFYQDGSLYESTGREGQPDIREVRLRSEEHTSELQSLMRISSAVFCLKKKKEIKHQCRYLNQSHNTV